MFTVELKTKKMEILEMRVEILLHKLRALSSGQDYKVIALNVIRTASTQPTDEEIKKEIETFYKN